MQVLSKTDSLDIDKKGHHVETTTIVGRFLSSIFLVNKSDEII